MKLQICPCTLNDVSLLSEISISTFHEAYTPNLDATAMALHTAEKFNEQQITIALQQANVQYYLAYNGNDSAGYLKLRLPNNDNPNNGLEISQIYARQAYWGRGVGLALLQQAIAIGIANQLPFIRLAVWQKNLRAIRFYQKMGFTISGTVPYYMGNDIHDDWEMKLKL